MRAKWPRWLVPNCSSKPSSVVASRRRHHAGVVDQQVDRAPLRQQRRSESLHRGQRSEIELEDSHFASDAAGRGRALRLVADGHQHLGAGPGQVPGELETDAVARAGDEGELAGQVRNVDVGHAKSLASRGF